MKFYVAIKRGEFTEKFCFENEAERSEFIEVTRQMDSGVEILLSEEEEGPESRPYHAFTA